MKRKKKIDVKVKEVQKWFEETVTYEGDPYLLDAHQAAAVADEGKNTLVVARAGSGKTRTLVAKIIYLVAKKGLRPDEITAFVFNANAASEINARLAKMLVNGESKIPEGAKIAQTFHAFGRRILYNIPKSHEKCGEILVDAREDFILALICNMLRDAKWEKKIREFIRGSEEVPEEGQETEIKKPQPLSTEEVLAFAGQMGQFINRAQQRYLASHETLSDSVQQYIKKPDLEKERREFIELGEECYRRYHWHLLGSDAKMPRFKKFGTDFNLIIAWASQIIASGRPEIIKLLGAKKYLLIDEYQDFSQLFLSVVRAIRKVAPEAKLFAVGDDWQAINRFAGSEVDYFKNFEHYFSEDFRQLEVPTNYRCDFQIVETARKFMKKAMGEKGNFRAFSSQPGEIFLVNPEMTDLDFAKIESDPRVSEEDRLYRKIAQRACHTKVKERTARYIKTLLLIIGENPTAREILILHRNNDMHLQEINLERLARTLRSGAVQLNLPGAKDLDKRLQAMTMHKSKGLEAETVIILEADTGIIPRSHPNVSLYEFFGETEETAIQDQKRLFYVAMTRAKKRLYIIHTPSTNKKEEGFIPFLGRALQKWRED